MWHSPKISEGKNRLLNQNTSSLTETVRLLKVYLLVVESRVLLC